MNPVRKPGALLIAAALGLAGCQSMTRAVNPPLTQIDPAVGDAFWRQGQSHA